MEHKELKAVIFDLDGVIVDTARYHYLAWKEAAKQLGYNLTESDNERFKGVSRMACVDILLEMSGTQMNDKEKSELAYQKNEIYLNFIMKLDKDDILPGAAPFIKELKQSKIPIAIASASKNTRLILGRLDILDYFDVIVDGHDTSNAKPDPEVFELAAKRLGVEAGSCIVFEDAVAGIQGAHRAGMYAVGVGDLDILKEADYVIKGLYDISLSRLFGLAMD